MNTEDSIYDSSWDEDNEELFDEKYSEWEECDWESWLNARLNFPFEVKREEDEEEWGDKQSKKLFGIGHVMAVLSICEDDDLYGIIVEVREGRKKGYIPLCDVEVTSKEDPNYWAVREYVVWFANH